MGSNKTYQRIFLSFILFLFLSIIYLPSICAWDYYADITIDVDSSGFVTIEGTTNHPDLLIKNTENYTSKKQSYWLLNITKKDIFSDFIYVLTLPKGSSIIFINSTGFIRIQEDLGNLLVRGYGENKSFSIIIQYQIEKQSDDKGIIQFDMLYVILTIVIITLIVMLAVVFIRDKKSKGAVEELKQNEIDTNFKGLNERQKQIMKLLIDREIPLTQTDIQRELNIPKAAVSRNIRGLELKGLIEKEQIGMSNLIRLKKP